jgi:hypothetical protein
MSVRIRQLKNYVGSEARPWSLSGAVNSEEDMQQEVKINLLLPLLRGYESLWAPFASLTYKDLKIIHNGNWTEAHEEDETLTCLNEVCLFNQSQ